MFKNYIKIAWRNLQKRKAFTFINILGLALGFGCVILIFLFITHHLQFDNFHENSDRIYRIVTEERSDEIEYEAAVPPGFANAFRNDFGYAEKVVSAYFRDRQQVNGVENNSAKQFKNDIAFVDLEFFEIFNFPTVQKLSNRSLIEPNTAFVTESFTKRMFGEENALGQSFVLENLETIQIIGVLKDLPNNSTIQGDAFISFKTLKAYDEFITSQSWGGIDSDLKCFAILHPNQDIAQIETSLVPLVAKHRPKSKNIHRYKLQEFNTVHLNSDYGGINTNLLWIFGLIGIFLITIACINFINISTAQAFYRSKEIGVRKVLGGQKRHFFWQFISETFIISLFALLIGGVVAFLALPKFNELFNLTLTFQKAFTLEFVVFILLLLTGVSFLAGSYPGVLLAKVLPTLALKGKLTQRDTGGQFTRKILVTTQFVVSVILIASTIIISKQINYAVNTDLGFDKDAIVMLDIPRDAEGAKVKGLRDRFIQLAGVKNASACLASPGGSYSNWSTRIKYDHRPESEEFSISAKLADENYVDAFDLKLVAGRQFIVSDSITEVMVNEKLAEKLGLASSEELIGKYVELNGGRIKAKISGVVANFHDQDFQSDISPVFISPNKKYYEYGVKINTQDISATLESIEKLWKETFPKYIYSFDFLDQRVAQQYEEEKRFLSLSKLFSGLAIFISCLGLYGLISFFVAQKTKEIGVRKVLGGSVSDILILFTRDFLKLIFIAGLIASPIAWYLMNNWLQNYRYRIAIDWSVFAIAIIGVLIIMLVTISYQVVRAAIENPVNSLKAE